MSYRQNDVVLGTPPSSPPPQYDKVILRIFGFGRSLDLRVGEGLHYQSLKLLSDYLNVCDHNPPTLQTDGTEGSTDRTDDLP